MKLLVKFNVIFVLVMALGVAVSGFITRGMLREQAREEVLSGGRMLIEQALAVRAYTSGEITKLLAEQNKEKFLPQSIPSYSANTVLDLVRAKHPEYGYKEATLNPTNPRDRASGWEVDIVNAFRGNAELKEFVGVRDTPTGPWALRFQTFDHPPPWPARRMAQPQGAPAQTLRTLARECGLPSPPNTRSCEAQAGGRLTRAQRRPCLHMRRNLISGPIASRRIGLRGCRERLGQALCP